MRRGREGNGERKERRMGKLSKSPAITISTLPQDSHAPPLCTPAVDDSKNDDDIVIVVVQST